MIESQKTDSMKAYVITNTGREIEVRFEETRIEQVFIHSGVEPLYDVGHCSPGRTNLAYSILYHHSGEAVAEQLCDDFGASYLSGQCALPVRIESKKINNFVSLMMQAQCDGEKVFQSMKPVDGK
jgi:hypothetical protein